MLNLLENLQCRVSWENIPLELLLVFHQFHLILGTRWTVGDIEADLSTVYWLLNAPASFPDKELSLNRRVPWLSPT